MKTIYGDEMTTTPTRLPWRADVYKVSGFGTSKGASGDICTEDNYKIAAVDPCWGYTNEQVEANLKLIATAVNTHDRAKEALQNIDRLAGCQSTNYEDLSLAIGECRTIARAILTDLEG